MLTDFLVRNCSMNTKYIISTTTKNMPTVNIICKENEGRKRTNADNGTNMKTNKANSTGKSNMVKIVLKRLIEPHLCKSFTVME